MTENEAIERLKCMRLFMQINDKASESKFLEEDYIANKLAVKALEEIQQYRAIGTVEECREARERQRGKKPVYPYLKSFPTCPNCGEVNLQQENEYGNVVENYDFCPDCGQAISWESDTI